MHIVMGLLILFLGQDNPDGRHEKVQTHGGDVKERFTKVRLMVDLFVIILYKSCHMKWNEAHVSDMACRCCTSH